MKNGLPPVWSQSRCTTAPRRRRRDRGRPRARPSSAGAGRRGGSRRGRLAPQVGEQPAPAARSRPRPRRCRWRPPAAAIRRRGAGAGGAAASSGRRPSAGPRARAAAAVRWRRAAAAGRPPRRAGGASARARSGARPWRTRDAAELGDRLASASAAASGSRISSVRPGRCAGVVPQRLDERLVRRHALLVAASMQHDGAIGVRRGGEPRRQARLADARLADHATRPPGCARPPPSAWNRRSAAARPTNGACSARASTGSGTLPTVGAKERTADGRRSRSTSARPRPATPGGRSCRRDCSCPRAPPRLDADADTRESVSRADRSFTRGLCGLRAGSPTSIRIEAAMKGGRMRRLSLVTLVLSAVLLPSACARAGPSACRVDPAAARPDHAVRALQRERLHRRAHALHRRVDPRDDPPLRPLADSCDHDGIFALAYLRTTEEYRRTIEDPTFFEDTAFVNHEDRLRRVLLRCLRRLARGPARRRRRGRSPMPPPTAPCRLAATCCSA